jgi:hypothetical protein
MPTLHLRPHSARRAADRDRRLHDRIRLEIALRRLDQPR